MIKSYFYSVSGSAADGQTWLIEGNLECDFNHVFGAAMEEAFDELTGRKVVYGKPGLGCAGPYDVTRVVIERTRQ